MKKKLIQTISALLVQFIILTSISFGTIVAASNEVTTENYDFTKLTTQDIKDLVSSGKMTIKNRDDSLWVCSDGLSITPSGTFGAGTFKNLFTVDGSGDYIATTSFDMTLGDGTAGWSDEAGFVIYISGGDYLRFVNRKNEQLFAEIRKGWGTEENKYAYIDFTKNKVEIMLQKKGNTYYFYYSLNGGAYIKLWEKEIELSAPSLSIYAGKHLTNANVTFKYFNIARNPWTTSYDFTKLTTQDVNNLISSGKITIKRGDDSLWVCSDGLSITPSGTLGADTFKNLFTVDGSGDYIATTSFDMTLGEGTAGWSDEAGFTVYADNGSYLRLVNRKNEQLFAETRKNYGSETNTYAYIDFTKNKVEIMLQKKGNTYYFYYSLNGGAYIKLWEKEIELSAPSLSIYAGKHFTNANVTFKYFNITRYKDTFSLNNESLTLKEGDTYSLQADANVAQWSSSDENVVKVSNSGKLTAMGEGYALVKAQTADYLVDMCVVKVMPAQTIVSDREGNPYLPLYEHIPDAEPYIFDDPDNPGKQRIYIYGSHDDMEGRWCGVDLLTWSAPVENPTQWRYDGVIYKSNVFGTTPRFYAPDITKVTDENGKTKYYLYSNPTSADSTVDHVAVSDRPDGPFVEHVRDASVETGSNISLTGDPAVFVDDDGSVYAYLQGNGGSVWAQLDPKTMETLLPGETVHKNLPSYETCISDSYNPAEWNIVQDEATDKLWRFAEASSLRKIGDKYVLIFARQGDVAEPTGGGNGQLAYGYSDSPKGPWKWGGVIVSCSGEKYKGENGLYSKTFWSSNTHGSLLNLNNEWYIFYHRGMGTGSGYGSGYTPIYQRQGMVDRVSVTYDAGIKVANGGKVTISTAEMTSKGFATEGLSPYKTHSAGLISYITGQNNKTHIDISFDRSKASVPVVDIYSGTLAGVKYFDMDKIDSSAKNLLDVEICPKGINGSVDVWLRPASAVGSPAVKTSDTVTSLGEGSFKLGTINITSDMPQEITKFSIAADKAAGLTGEWGVFFAFNSDTKNAALCDLHTVGFSKKIDINTLTYADGTARAIVTASENITADFIFASYDIGNTLIGVEYLENITIEKGERVFNSSKIFTTTGATNIKFMIWDSDMSPLCKGKDIPLNYN